MFHTSLAFHRPRFKSGKFRTTAFGKLFIQPFGQAAFQDQRSVRAPRACSHARSTFGTRSRLGTCTSRVFLCKTKPQYLINARCTRVWLRRSTLGACTSRVQDQRSVRQQRSVRRPRVFANSGCVAPCQGSCSIKTRDAYIDKGTSIPARKSSVYAYWTFGADIYS